MDETRKLILGDEELPVLRWLREDVSVEAGTTHPGMIARDAVDHVRDHQDQPFVVRDGSESWSARVVAIESTGSEGVWITVRISARIGRPQTVTPANEEARSTLLGGPVAGLKEALADDSSD